MNLRVFGGQGARLLRAFFNPPLHLAFWGVSGVNYCALLVADIVIQWP